MTAQPAECRCGVHGFAMSPCESLPVATAPYYREARVTAARRQTACGRGIAALATLGSAAHSSLRIDTARNRALLREARVTVARRQTACGRGIAALAALFSLLLGRHC